MSDFVSVHVFFACVLVLLEVLYFVFAINLKDIHKYIFRIRVLLPAYYTAYACVFFTGIVIEALKGFNNYNYVMSLCLVLMFAIAIFQFIRFKKARKVKRYEDFKKLSLVLEPIKLILLVLAWNSNVLL